MTLWPRAHSQQDAAHIMIVAGAALVTTLLMLSPSALAQERSSEHWVGTWAAVPVARCPGRSAGQAPPTDTRQCQPPEADATPGEPIPFSRAPLPVLRDQTVRQIVRVSIGGESVRVVLTNAYGTVPLMIGAAHVALREEDGTVVKASARALTFGGRPTATVPPGAVMVSDPVALTVPALADLAIDVYLPGDTLATPSPITVHAGTGGLQTNYISPTGDHTGAETLPVMTTTQAWFFLARVDVRAPANVGAIVALGDSILLVSTRALRVTPPISRSSSMLSPVVSMSQLSAGTIWKYQTISPVSMSRDRIQLVYSASPGPRRVVAHGFG